MASAKLRGVTDSKPSSLLCPPLTPTPPTALMSRDGGEMVRNDNQSFETGMGA